MKALRIVRASISPSALACPVFALGRARSTVRGLVFRGAWPRIPQFGKTLLDASSSYSELGVFNNLTRPGRSHVFERLNRNKVGP